MLLNQIASQIIDNACSLNVVVLLGRFTRGWTCREPRAGRRWSSERGGGIRPGSEQTGMPLCEVVVGSVTIE